VLADGIWYALPHPNFIDFINFSLVKRIKFVGSSHTQSLERLSSRLSVKREREINKDCANA
jgi:hypothetical protein